MDEIESRLAAVTAQAYGKTIETCSNEEMYYALLALSRDLMAGKPRIRGSKKLYYISAEFLIGRLLSSNLLNLGIYDEVKRILASKGLEIADIEEVEPEPSLGNGGLGRLAACFLDSIASLGLAGDGVGLCYHLGLFKQVFADKLQTAVPNEWIESQSWLNRTETTYRIEFGDRAVTSRMYDIDAVGYEGGVNKLHLFDIESVDESIVQDGIDFDKTDIEHNLTLFLYPDDSDEAGNLLRVYQQYFMVANAARLILDEQRAEGYDLRDLPQHVAIQINDTHPTMVIPELVRLLVMEEDFTLTEAINVVSHTCAYTNHTILAEALEKWPLRFIAQVAPQLVPFIQALDKRAAAKYPDPKLRIIDENRVVHMAHIDIHYGYSVNGVARLHTDILKNTELNAFYRIYPDKFNNKTNGITFRRWLMCCNRELTDLIADVIGDGFKKSPDELKNLMKMSNDDAFLNKLEVVKRDKKRQLAIYVGEKEGIALDPNSIFDVQVKRLHEYKRQQMNALYIIHKYLEIKAGKLPARPLTFIFGAKAAPAYTIAKDIIHLILTLAYVIDQDLTARQYMRVVMLENYNVSYAERVIPAADISEQISLASKEASGTGNMKFMLNGAVTIGTMDGANVEISELVGPDNIYTFGESSEQVIDHYASSDYVSKQYYEDSPVIKEAVDFIVSPEMLAAGHEENLTRLYNELLNKDWFMTLLDLEDYIATKDRMFADYEDRPRWRRMMLANIANAGFFSSDRTIEEYNRDIWHLK